MEDSQIHWCAWHCLDGLGDAAVNRLISRFEFPPDAYTASPELLTSLGFKPAQLAVWLDFARQPNKHRIWQLAEDWLAQHSSISLVSIHDVSYPVLLRQIQSPPALLYVRGRVELLNRPQIAIVGSRRASAAGLAHARQFAQKLAENGLVITSGGALGIDAAAHAGALTSGASIAVIGTGIDIDYPRQNQQLFDQLAISGAIATEFRPSSAPKPQHFPRRNRIIAGMSFATLVVEAALRSGSLITARQALEFNRDVFAIPGAINDPRAKGTNVLIKQGAKLTETVSDIVDEFVDRASFSVHARVQLRQEETDLLACIDFAPTQLDLIAERSQLPVHQLLPQLLELELAGLIAKDVSGYCRV